MTENTQTYICTRPTLAAQLIENGHTCTKTSNPWRPERDAWIFQVDEALRNTVAQYYTNIGKPIPTTLRKGVETE